VTDDTGRGHESQHSDAVLLAAGIADVVVSGLSTALGGLRGLLGRADAPDLADEARQEIQARGRLALDRCAVSSPAHLEVLARHVAARRGDRADA
jgi:hypothetical protein